MEGMEKIALMIYCQDWSDVEHICFKSRYEGEKAMYDMKNIGADIIKSDEFLNNSNFYFSDSLNKCRYVVRKCRL